MSEWRNNLASIERRPDLALQSAQIIDLAIAIHPNPDLFSGRVSSAYFADQPEELLETIRRMTYLIKSELDYLLEDNKADSPLIGFRSQQIELIELTLDEVAQRRTLNSVSLVEVRERLDQLKLQISGI